MAKVRQNVVIHGLSGQLGDQIMIRRDKAGRTIVGVKPAFDENHVFTEAQKNAQEQFREAAASGNPKVLVSVEDLPGHILLASLRVRCHADDEEYVRYERGPDSKGHGHW